jgi:hypothetical protein
MRSLPYHRHSLYWHFRHWCGVEWCTVRALGCYSTAQSSGRLPHPIHLSYIRRTTTRRVDGVYIAKVDDTVGHGLFAAVGLLPATFIGEYTGLICEDGIDDDNGYRMRQVRLGCASIMLGVQRIPGAVASFSRPNSWRIRVRGK